MPRVELPSADADYLSLAQKIYPPASRRLGEPGRVLLHVLIGVDGKAQKVPPLLVETADDEERVRHAHERRADRLRRKAERG